MKNTNTNTTRPPCAGDVILALDGPNIGKLAVIEGIGYKKADDWFMVCFDASAHRYETIINDELVPSVSCSGGPSFFLNIENLVFSGEKITRSFWNSKIDEVDKTFKLNVNLWLYSTNKPLGVQMHQSTILKSMSDLHLLKNNVQDAYAHLQNQANRFHLTLESYSDYEVKRGEYLICPTWKRFHPSHDHMAKFIIEHYYSFKAIQIFEHEEPVGCGYLYTTGKGIAFRNKSELDNWINAYQLKIKEDKGAWDSILIEPNIDIDSWAPLTLVLPH